MYKKLSLCLLVAAVGCAQVTPVAQNDTATDRVARMISSVADERVLEEGYKKLLESQTPEEDMTKLMERVALVYFRGQGLLDDYDTRLDRIALDPSSNAASIMGDLSYARMMAARILKEKAHSQIVYYYERNLEEMNNRGTDSPADRHRQDQALLLNSALKKVLVSKGKGTFKLALQDILADLIAVNKEFRESRHSGAQSATANDGTFSKVAFKNEKEVQKFLKDNAKALKLEAKKAAKDDVINQEISAMEKDLQDHLKTQAGREPNAEGVIVPSSGSNGNLTGNTFKTGRWALTYDDGPSIQTPNILDNLKGHNLKATFFWLSSLTPKFKTLSQKAINEYGMNVANHSQSHADLTKLGSVGLNREIVESSKTHQGIYGFKPKLFRCPYGACGGNGSTIRKMIANEGMVHVFWNVDSLDWQDKNIVNTYNRVKKAMAVAKRGIILFHDIHARTIETTRMLMDDWVKDIKKGTLRLVTVQQAVDELNSPQGMQ